MADRSAAARWAMADRTAGQAPFPPTSWNELRTYFSRGRSIGLLDDLDRWSGQGSDGALPSTIDLGPSAAFAQKLRRAKAAFARKLPPSPQAVADRSAVDLVL